MTAVLVIVGAMVGAPLRYLTDRAVQARHDSEFPWGTLTVNLLGSLILGLVAGAGSHLSPGLVALLGTGFCGALTTYSTFSYETLRLFEKGERFFAGCNIVVSVAASLGAVVLGYSITS